MNGQVRESEFPCRWRHPGQKPRSESHNLLRLTVAWTKQQLKTLFRRLKRTTAVGLVVGWWWGGFQLYTATARVIERAEWQLLPLLQPVPFSASDSINVLGTNEFIEPAHTIIANVRQSRESHAVILIVYAIAYTLYARCPSVQCRIVHCTIVTA